MKIKILKWCSFLTDAFIYGIGTSNGMPEAIVAGITSAPSRRDETYFMMNRPEDLLQNVGNVARGLCSNYEASTSSQGTCAANTKSNT